MFDAAGAAAIAMASNAAQQANHILISKTHDSFDVADMLFDGAVSFVCGAWGGDGASYGNTAGIKSAGKQLFKRGFFDPKARDYYFKTARRMGEYVFKSLLNSLGKSAIGSAVIVTKNIIKSHIR